MTIKEMYIKYFQKSKAVIIKLADESGRLTTHWAVPDNNEKTVKLSATDKSIVLHNDKMYLSTKHNIPTYIVHYLSCEPIDLAEVTKTKYTTQDLDLILKTDMADKVFRASNKSKLSDEGKIIIIAVVLIGLALGYFINTKFQDLSSTLNPEPVPIVEPVVVPDPVDDGDPFGG